MGILDNLGHLGETLTGGSGDATASPRAGLTQALLGMLVHGNEPGGLGGSGGIGGLAGLLQRFENAGLGNQVASWIGNGQNLPVSADQIKSALSGGPLETLAQHTGTDENGVAGHLAGLLPQLIDRLTPNGQVPAGGVSAGGVTGALESLGAMFGGRSPAP